MRTSRLARVSAVCPRVLVALLALVAVRCGDKITNNNYYGALPGGDDGNGGQNTAAIESCTPDPARVSALEACRADDQCPCGAACNNGQCSAQCTNDADCGSGQRCDTFGRCRASDDGATVATLQAQTVGTLTATPPYILAPGGLDQFVRIHADGNAIVNLRIAADDGLEVSCDGASFVDACAIDSIAAGADLVVELRTTSPIADGDVRTLQVFGGDQVASIVVASSPPSLATTGTTESGVSILAGYAKSLVLDNATTNRPVGRYSGMAVIKDIGSRISPATSIPTSAVAGTPPSQTFALDLTAEIYPITPAGDDVGYYTVVLHDASHILLPTGDVIGVLRGHAPADSYDVEIYAQPWVTTTFASAADPLGDDPEYVDVRARYLYEYKDDAGAVTLPAVADITKTNVANGTIAFDILTQYDVADRNQNAPKTRWTISLTYVSDLSVGATAPAAPQATIADVPTLPLRRFLTSSLTEARVAASLVATSPMVIAQTWMRQKSDLGACKLSPLGLDSSVSAAAVDPTIDAAAQADIYSLLWLGDTAATTDASTLPVKLTTARGAIIAFDPSLDPVITEMAATGINLAGYIIYAIDYSDTITVPVHSFSVDSGLDGVGDDLNLREIPCAMTGEAGHLSKGAPNVVINAKTYDRCSNLAAITHCEPRDLTVTEMAQPEATLNHAFTNGITLINLLPAGGTSNLKFTNNRDFTTNRNFQITRVCRMPSTPLVCAELAACHGGRADSGNNASALLQNDFGSASGDAVCGAGDHAFGIDADVNGAGLSATEMLAACVDDANTLATAPTNGGNLQSTMGSHGCASMGGLLAGMGAASDSLREAALQTVGVDRLHAASMLSHRLFVRFADLFGFIARESANAEQYAPAARRDQLAGADVLPTPQQALTASLRGWSVLFAPRFQVAMQHIDTPTLVNPDYRVLYGQVPATAATQPLDPLALALLRTSTAQLQLAQNIVENAGTDAIAAVNLAGQTLRYAMMAEAVAHDLVDRAHVLSPTPSWNDRYLAAEAGFVAARENLVVASRNAAATVNALGIAESDVPLYFTGGQISDDGRYFAISDYLIGTTAGSSDNWAPSLINDAQGKLDAARSAWLEREDRVVANSRDEAERATRIANLKQTYGSQLAQLCGAPAGLATADILDQWQQFDPQRCFIDTTNASCTIPADKYASAVTNLDIQKTASILQNMGSIFPGAAIANSESLDAEMRSCPASKAGAAPCTGGRCFACDGLVTSAQLNDEFAAIQSTASSITDSIATMMQNIIDTQSSQMKQLSQFQALSLGSTREAASGPPSVGSVASSISALWPTASSIGVNPPSSCYRGDIGEQQLAIAAIAKDIDIARAQFDSFQASYNITMKKCIAPKGAQTQGFDPASYILSLAQAQDQAQAAMNKTLAALGLATSTAQQTKDCQVPVALPAIFNFKPASVSVACTNSVVAANTNKASTTIATAMTDAAKTLQQPPAIADNSAAQNAYAACQAMAQQDLIDAQNQGLRAQRAMADLQAAQLQLNNLKAQALRTWNDGQSALKSEQNRTLTPLDTDLWLDERVSAYTSAMRIAKRVTYLAVRAVEYEFQQSLAARGDVLDAQVPQDLENALATLRTYTAPRTVRGSKPTNKKAVLSLRDAILRMLDQTSATADNHRLTASQRLQIALTSQKYAKFAADGTYLGQQVPFTVSPTGLGTSSDASLEIYAQDSCAEKVWSVNASILGSGLLRGSSATFTNMTVMKANTFSSQWCDDTGRDTPLQTVSVRPERNLFQDSIAGSPDFIAQQLAGADSLFSKALIQPSLNVPRDQFESDAYANGDSSQLAARGLYGEYALFFPAQVLSQNKGSTITDGLDLTHIDDILIRFDYVTVAR